MVSCLKVEALRHSESVCVCVCAVRVCPSLTASTRLSGFPTPLALSPAV